MPGLHSNRKVILTQHPSKINNFVILPLNVVNNHNTQFDFTILSSACETKSQKLSLFWLILFVYLATGSWLSVF